MNTRSLLSLSFSLLGWLIVAGSAEAQATRIFVASTGNDANDGSRGSPKRNFQAAHDAVVVGGEVVALDTAGYGAVTINKSVAITVPPGITGFVTTQVSNAIIINAGADSIVSLRGLTISAVNASGGTHGIEINTVGTLSLSNCIISGYDTGVVCQSSVDTDLVVSQSSVRGNRVDGVLVASGSTSFQATFDRCEVVSNGQHGLAVGAATGGGGQTHRIELHDTLIANSTQSGVLAVGQNVFVILQGCTVSANSRGLNIQTGATVKVDGCAITGNTTAGLQFGGAGASLLSRGNNTVEDNTTDGTFSGTYTAK